MSGSIVGELVKDVDREKALMDILDKLLLLYKSGALDTAVELLLTAKNLSTVVADSMVDNLASILRELAPLIDALANSPLVKLLSEALNDADVDKAILKARGGVRLSDVVGLARDEDVYAGLYVFLTVMKALGRRVRSSGYL